MELNLLGKVVIQGSIHVVTGLRIGGPTTGLKIGGVDQPVISDAFGRPYIPGSSLKGKLRTLIERKEKVKLNKTHKIKEGGQEKEEPYAHECDKKEDYERCPVCKIWGILGTDKIKDISVLTRLIVRDIYLDESSITEEMKRNLELEWTEIKMETAIDRYKGTALRGSLRTIDRVPAGAKFSPMEIIYNVYEESDKDILVKVFEAMELLEHDYLGGMGSRGYGKVEFKNIEIYWNKKEDYENGKLNQNKINNGFDTPAKIVKNFENIKQNIKTEVKK
ncbi:MAG: type III-A CRISPR-associated RAMP protein Csm3 [Candidatus Omnitrophica bacterium]|nr:type III-A CRISPR-associated RAMP protein Csm3 [Candidatus Omnitrophota bacterium]